MWPLTFAGEIDLVGGNSILPEEIASYAYPPGRHERYTDAGWAKAKALGIAEQDVRDFAPRGS